MSPAEREALARLGEAIRHASHSLAEGFTSLGDAAIRAGEAFATFTAQVKTEGDGE